MLKPVGVHRVPVFISFHYAKDLDLKNGLVAQANRPDAPFSIQYFSITRPIDKGWDDEARRRIAQCRMVFVICGPDVHNSPGVAREIELARSLNKPVHLLDPGPNRDKTWPPGMHGQPRHPMTYESMAKLVHGPG